MELDVSKLKSAQEASGKKLTGLDVKVVANQVLFKLIENTFKKEKTESGIFIPENTFQKSEKTGEDERFVDFYFTGEVVEVGEKTISIKKGDIVIVPKNAAMPVPIGEPGTLFVVSEISSICYIQPSYE